MSRIVLVNPPQVLEESYGKLGKVFSVTPPLGICSLAAYAREKGHDVAMLDAVAENLGHAESVERILQHSPQFVGITATTDIAYNAGKLAAMIKDVRPDITTIIGAHHVSALPERTMQEFPAFDIGVVGEGEQTLVELLAAMEDKRDLGQVAGLVYRCGDEIIRTANREYISDLDILPFPAWDILPDITTTYRPSVINYRQLPNLSVMTTRGCIGHCTFCNRSVFQNRCRAFSADYVIRMIEYVADEFGIRDLCFCDDIFIIFKERLQKICRHLAERRPRITWCCQSRVDIVDPETLQMIKESGCWKIAFGIESGSQEVLDIAAKGIRLEQSVEAVRCAKQVGLAVEAYIMLGFPNETKESLKKTERFINKLPAAQLLPSFYTPYPGTAIYETIHQYGSLSDDWHGMDALNKPKFIPNGLTEEDLLTCQSRILMKFYLQPRIIWHYFVEMLRPSKTILMLKSLAAFLRFNAGSKKEKTDLRQGRMPEDLRKLYRPAGALTLLRERIRWRLCPFRALEELLPAEGKIVDIGSGSGILANLAALRSSQRELIGIDSSEEKCKIANLAAEPLTNVEFVCSDASDADISGAAAVVLCDVIHHITSVEQQRIISHLADNLSDEATLFLLDIDTTPGWKFWPIVLLDRLSSGGECTYFRSASRWQQTLTEAGFECETIKMSRRRPVPHTLFVCKKTRRESH